MPATRRENSTSSGRRIQLNPGHIIALLAVGSDPQAIDNSGNRPLDYASKNTELIGSAALQRLVGVTSGD
jgi:hypothetical protein